MGQGVHHTPPPSARAGRIRVSATLPHRRSPRPARDDQHCEPTTTGRLGTTSCSPARRTNSRKPMTNPATCLYTVIVAETVDAEAGRPTSSALFGRSIRWPKRYRWPAWAALPRRPRPSSSSAPTVDGYNTGRRTALAATTTSSGDGAGPTPATLIRVVSRSPVIPDSAPPTTPTSATRSSAPSATSERPGYSTNTGTCSPPAPTVNHHSSDPTVTNAAAAPFSTPEPCRWVRRAESPITKPTATRSPTSVLCTARVQGLHHPN